MAQKKTAAVDFDNTLAGYDKWRGSKVLGPPIPYAVDAIKELKEWGWHVVINTTRLDKILIADWLTFWKFPQLLINDTSHNPPDTSHKPIAEVYFEDRDAHCVGEIPYNWHRAMRRVRKLYQPRLDVDIDDAASWANLFTTYWVAPMIRKAYRKGLKAWLDQEEARVYGIKPTEVLP